MIYRMRVYQANSDQLERSRRVFFDEVFPVHVHHGARFVERWLGDGRIVVVWEYDSRAECERIQALVAADPRTIAKAQLRAEQGLLAAERDEWILESTVPEGRGLGTLRRGKGPNQS